MSDANASRSYFWQVAWPVVLAANLIVPLMFGLEETRHGGRWGMGLAIALIWLLGHVGCAWSKELGFILVTGGTLVGLSQFFPFLHIMAGSMSLNFVSRVGLSEGGHAEVPFPDRLTEFGGFLATLLTGGQLLFAAAICGLAVRVITHQSAPGGVGTGERN